MRHGIPLGRVKVAIIDLIDAHDEGVTLDDLVAEFGGADVSKRQTVRSHVHQLRHMLTDERSDAELVSETTRVGNENETVYRLRQKRPYAGNGAKRK